MFLLFLPQGSSTHRSFFLEHFLRAEFPLAGSFFFFFLLILVCTLKKIYLTLFLAVLDPGCSVRAFFQLPRAGATLVAEHELLIAAASLVVGHRL